MPSVLPRLLLCGTICCILASAALAQAVDRQPSVAARQATRCIEAAAQYHRVNASVLRAILQVESALNPHALHRNADGSWDIGIGQINTIHLKELSQWHLTPAHLLDACIGTYVAAWYLSRQMSRHGNTWKAVGPTTARPSASIGAISHWSMGNCKRREV